MKDYIINMLNKAIKEGKNDKNDNSYDIAFLKEIIDKINNDKDYFYEFILDLNSDLIKDLTLLLEPADERESFLASIIYLKNLMEINKKEEIKIPISTAQEEIIYELIELIKKIVDTDKTNESEEKKYLRKYGKNYSNLLNKLENNKEISIEDYDLIESLVLKYEKGSSDLILNDVVDYLNNYNYRLLPKMEETYDENEPDIEISEENEEIIIRGIKDSENVLNSNDNNDFKTQRLTLEEDTRVNETANNSKNDELDEKTKEKDSSTYDSEVNLENDALKLLDLENISLNEYCTSLINKGINKNVALFVMDHLKPLFISDNYNAIISICCLSDEDALSDIFTYFMEIKLSKEAIEDLINRATHIFFTKNKDMFKQNVNLLEPYNIDIDNLIRNNITYFYNSPIYNQNKIKLLEECGINISKLFEIKPQIFAIGLDKLLKNIDLLEKYGLSINEDEYDSISIISNPNLSIMIDTFVEAGFSSYFLRDGLKNIRSLIIKRIFYAFKNGLNVWYENITNDRINSKYEEWILKERKALTEEEMSYLVSDYPLLEYVELSKRPTNFNDISSAQIKRKYEFKFDNIIISRLKVYSVFKVLVEHKVSESEALFYAITYNSNLEVDDYNKIKKEILRK